MIFLKRILKWTCLAVVLLLVGGYTWLYARPPELLRVGAGYAAKIICSNVFIANRDADLVLADDVQAPGHPLLKLMSATVDRERQTVTTSLTGGIARTTAEYHAGLGCRVLPAGAKVVPLPVIAEAPKPAPDSSLLWPQGGAVQLDPAVQDVLAREDLAGPGARAIVVIRDGRLVGERYAKGFSAQTPLLGWSMTKTVNAALVGIAMGQRAMKLDDASLFAQWKNDSRASIRVADLLSMEDGLAFNENYGNVSDVTRMLYLEPDMVSFMTQRPAAAPPGTVFTYSTGSPVLLSRLWMDHLGDTARALRFPQKALFDPIGMSSAVMEVDAAGTFVGGSYLYATARDWARFGLLLAQDGVWNGSRILPEGFTALMAKPNKASDGRYSQAQTWLPKVPDGASIPAGWFRLQGHDGQTITVIPATRTVILRMGLTPRKLDYSPNALVAAVLALR